MTMELKWTENARRERLDLIEYIARDNLDAAFRIDERIQAAAENLLIFPEQAPVGRIKGTRDLFVKPRYRLIYQVTDEAIIILSILHTSQRYPVFLPEI